MTIKNPTYRKVTNRGFKPVNYHTDLGIFTGWVEKEGRTLLHFRFADGRLKRVPKSEAKYMKPLVSKHGSVA